MVELKPCLIDRNKIPFKELWQEASCFADDIVCAVGTDFMLKNRGSGTQVYLRFTEQPATDGSD